MTALPSTTRLRSWAAWGLQVPLATAFLAAGISKLAGAAMMVDLFDTIGIGQWFRYVTGVVEVGGAALLLIPGIAAAGAALLGATMIFAVLTHLLLVGGSPAPALVLLALSFVLLALRWDEVANLRQRTTALLSRRTSGPRSQKASGT